MTQIDIKLHSSTTTPINITQNGHTACQTQIEYTFEIYVSSYFSVTKL